MSTKSLSLPASLFVEFLSEFGYAGVGDVVVVFGELVDDAVGC